MTLSEPERDFLRKEERRERSWRSFRWLALFGSALGLAVTLWNMRRLLDLMTDNGGSAWAWFAPFAWFTLIVMGGLLGWTLSRWRGDVKAQLLTRLIREHEKAVAQLCAPPNGGPSTALGDSGVTKGPPSVS
jgi:hypothetical protein